MRKIVIQRPFASEVIGYLDRLDSGGFSDSGDSPAISSLEILRETGYGGPSLQNRIIASGVGHNFLSIEGSNIASSEDASSSRIAMSGPSTGDASPTLLVSPSSGLVQGSDQGVQGDPSAKRVLGPSERVDGASIRVRVQGPSDDINGASTSKVDVSARKKKGKMGIEERKVANLSSAEKHQILMSAINAASTAYEDKLEEIAEANGVKVARVKQLALHAPPITQKRKVSDWNIMVHFKGKELNEGMSCLCFCYL